MSERIYEVTLRPAGAGELVFRLALCFGILIGTIGLSRAWFGGSWAVDLLALVAALAILSQLPRRSGKAVRMTREELQAWAQAGCPDTWGKGD